MKKILILILALCCVSIVMGQDNKKKVAVYIASSADEGIGKVVGSKIVDAITRQSDYVAVERTSEFLAQLQKEQKYQREGNVDDNQISKLGKQFGVDLVCVADITLIMNSYFVAARLINVETATVIATGNDYSGDTKVIENLVNTVDVVTANLLGISSNTSKKTINMKTASSNIEVESSDEKITADASITTETNAHTGVLATVTNIFRKKQSKDIKEKTVASKEPILSTVASANFDMVYVQGSSFIMGSPKDQKGGEKNEKPSHKVTLSDFYISKTEVTHAQWKAVMGSYPSKKFKGDDMLPVCVSWIEIQDFIGRLNTKTGLNYRLPSEAEWEYAARGGSESKDYKYSGSNNVDDVAWYKDISGNKIHLVGTRQANELGLYDMSGNVWEWCSDRYTKYSSSSQLNPVASDSGNDRVIRGGSWDTEKNDVRVLRRLEQDPKKRSEDIGFRLASDSK